MELNDSGGDIAQNFLFGVPLLVVGTVFVTNYRGLMESHVRRSFRSVAPLRRVPPLRWLSPSMTEPKRFQFLLARIVGGALALGGLDGLIRGVLDLIA